MCIYIYICRYIYKDLIIDIFNEIDEKYTMYFYLYIFIKIKYY